MKENNISGRVACKGKVEGPARIIHKPSDLQNVQPGDILITSQTNINYVPYLRDCIGLITETGGRYCHASIFSRENQLPCIIDVDGAMNTFIDGEYLILDADNNKISTKTIMEAVQNEKNCGS
jgi:phosphohistidine swiveling domain-containing protein